VAETTFWGLPLATLPGRVMSPRPASEQLVSEALARLGGRAARVVDVGTGCGAVAIALAVAAPALEVWATDVSEAAVALARMNAARHGIAERVHVRQGDLLAPVLGAFDLVVANLPYLPERERARHPDLAGEPFTAVFSHGDGLDPYRRMLRQSECRLSDGGAVVLQFDRGVFAAGRDELAALSAALSPLAAAA
jgi:release factor glutamine methyltransferase